jgi:hypothetical protein
MYNEVWVTQDNREIKVDDMTEAHVRAVLNMLLRNDRLRKEEPLRAYYAMKGEEAMWGK